MTTEQLAAAIRAKLEAVIAAAEAAESGPWRFGNAVKNPRRVLGDVWNSIGVISEFTSDDNAAFIAQARTTSPQMARALLGTVNIAEQDDDWQTLGVIARELGIGGQQ